MKGWLIALAVVGGALLLRRGSADDAADDTDDYHILEDSVGDWFVMDGDKIVCGPLPMEANALDSLKRYRSTQHC